MNKENTKEGKPGTRAVEGRIRGGGGGGRTPPQHSSGGHCGPGRQLMDNSKVTEQEVAILFQRGCGSDRIPK